MKIVGAPDRERDVDTIRFCLREPRGGRTSPTGIVCTGAFDPDLLRSGKSIFEDEILKILADDAKFGVRYDR